MKRRQRSIAALAIAALLAGAGCDREREPVFTGYAEADLVYVASSGAGTLLRLDVARGARVEANAPLFALDAEPERIERNAAQARILRAQSQVQNLSKGRRAPELSVIQQQLAQAEAQLDISAQALKRNEALVEQGSVAEIRLDELRAARERDEARVAELRAQLLVARTAARPDEIAAAQAERKAADSDLAQVDWREQQKVRRAPQAALVYDVLFRVGEWVAAGTPVIALLPDNALKVRFFVPQGRLAQLAPGTVVNIACDGCPTGLTATVGFVAPQAEYTPPVIYSNESRDKLVFLIEARPDDAARKVLKAGQPLDVRLRAAPAAAGAR
jgi:HlyD family secretion protein